MADDSLNVPVVVQASRIDATLLPSVFSLPYQLYVVQQGADFGAVAGKANEAGSGAYDAQVKNDEQDIELADHEERITSNTVAIAALDIRVINAENAIIAIKADVATLKTKITTIEGDITTLQASVTAIQSDYISKSATTNQSIQSVGGSLLVGSIPSPTTDKLQVSGSGNVSVSYKVSGIQVVGARQTGWTASAGTPNKSAFNADLTFTVGAIYSQSEVQAIASALVAERQRTKALEDVMRTHGLIN